MAERATLGLLEISLFNRNVVELLQECREAGLDAELRKDLDISEESNLEEAVIARRETLFAERHKAFMVHLLMEHYRSNPDNIPPPIREDIEKETSRPMPVLYSVRASAYIPVLPIVPGDMGQSQESVTMPLRPGRRVQQQTTPPDLSPEGSIEAPARQTGETMREALTLVGHDFTPTTLEVLCILGYKPEEEETWNAVRDAFTEGCLAAVPNFARLLVKAFESTREKRVSKDPAPQDLRQSLIGMLMRSAYPGTQRVNASVADLMAPFGIAVEIIDDSDASQTLPRQSSRDGVVDGVDEREYIWLIPRSFRTRLEAEVIAIKSAITEYLSE